MQNYHNSIEVKTLTVPLLDFPPHFEAQYYQFYKQQQDKLQADYDKGIQIVRGG